MPHTSSAKKRLRQTKKRREHNVEMIKDIKIQIKEFQRILKGGDKAAIDKQFKTCAKKLDKAGAKRVIHPNKAAHKKSQLARMLKAPQAGSAASKS